MPEPLISIIIPCCNAERCVGEAIGSALGQTYRNVEVIVIDDGSTDGSLDVIRSVGERIRWETGPNRGGCVARNRGIELARGELLQFLDADDLLHRNKLERQVVFAESMPERISYCDHLAYLSGNASNPVLRSMGCEELDAFVFVLKHRALQTSAPLHRRHWIQEIGGFRAGLQASQDFDLHLRLAVAGRRFAHLPVPLFTVRRRPTSVSSDTGQTFAVLADVLPRIALDLERAGVRFDERRRELAAYSARAGRLCLRHHHELPGLQLLRFACDLDRRAAERAAYSLPALIGKRLIGPLGVERIGRFRRTVGLGVRGTSD